MSEAEAAAAPVAPGPSKGPMILVLVNTIAVLAALGMVVYTKILFKRPTITEDAERDRLAELKSKARAPTIPGLVNFEPATVNIQPTQAPAATAGANPGRMKLHYATLGFSLEISDSNRKGLIEELRPRVMDQLLSLMGRKSFADLTTVQGRYLLRSQIADIVNRAAATAEGAQAHDSRTPLVTNVYFTQFIVQ